ncbi:thioredoxin domain-containing protein 9-like [Tubulanus polymorphus]|uniref:thioredoxin domain-containing protein 9-like n=1 Tax=Tubulanus polymorphus TaxID=672921 RepID=UPI003DA4CEE3
MAGIAHQLEEATKVIEQQVDAKIEELDRIQNQSHGDEEYELLKKQRMQALKKMANQKKEYMDAGHGKYFEVADEKEFFEECKKSKNVVCHFYRESTFRCKIVDKHLTSLAVKHLETKFIKIDAEKSQFLTKRLKITMMPTIALILDRKTVDFIKGFDDLGKVDDFSTELLEWRIAGAGVINYSGDLMVRPGSDAQPKKNKPVLGLGRPEKKRNLRDEGNDSSSDDEDW